MPVSFSSRSPLWLKVPEYRKNPPQQPKNRNIYGQWAKGTAHYATRHSSILCLFVCFFSEGHKNCDCYLWRYNPTLSGVITSATNCNLLCAVIQAKITICPPCVSLDVPLFGLNYCLMGFLMAPQVFFGTFFITLGLHCSWQQSNEKGGITCQTHLIPSAHSLRFIWGFYSKMIQGEGTTGIFSPFVFLWGQCS